jgi:ribonuclease BN (tRNA processing enzyme)
MQLTLHGTGAGSPNPDRLASAATLRFSDGSILLLDAGEGCSRAMRRDGIDLERITTVAVSHMHADHWCGLPGLVVAWSIVKRTSPVEIHLPEGMIPFFRSVLLHSFSFPEKRTVPLHFRRLAQLELPDGWSLSLFPTTHLDSVAELATAAGLTAKAFGYVLGNGKRRIVLSADLGAKEDLDGVIDDAELLVCESTHIIPTELLEFARERRVRRVIFTHIPIDGVEFPSRFEGIEWAVAKEGESLEVQDVWEV